MNNGKVTKNLYSNSPKVSSWIKDCLDSWEHGHCALVAPPSEPKSNSWNSWYIEIPSHLDEQSTKALIDAYVHLGCGFSYADIDLLEFENWVNAGDQFQSANISSDFKELGYELHHEITKLKSDLLAEKREITAIMVTAVGKHISIEDSSLFGAIVRSNNIYSLNNGCHLDDQSDLHLKLHISIAQKCDSSYTTPPFLKN